MEIRTILRSLRLVGLLVLLPSWNLRAQTPPVPNPNVLMICVDDLKPLLGCYGNTTVRTPNIDALAAGGMTFDRAYCDYALCSPSRNAILAGFRPDTLGIYDISTNFRHAAPGALTLPQWFKARGYHARSLGKVFHTGNGNTDDAASWSVPSWKPSQTFYANSFTGTPPAFESGNVPDNFYEDGQIADRAVQFLNDWSVQQPGAPFFLAVGFLRPHLPFNAPTPYWDLYDPNQFVPDGPASWPAAGPPVAATNWEELRGYRNMPAAGPLSEQQARQMLHGYHAAVSYMDAQVGRVLAALQSSGLASNTLIVFWGDHGWHLGDHGFWSKLANYEQSARIPLIFSAPWLSNPGAHADALVQGADIYPTVCELTGGVPPSGIDGVGFLNAFLDPYGEWDEGLGRDAVLQTTMRATTLGRSIRTRRYRMVEWKTPGAPASTAIHELYDLESDPLESVNLAGTLPATLSAMKAILARYPEARPQIVVATPTPTPMPNPAAPSPAGFRSPFQEIDGRFGASVIGIKDATGDSVPDILVGAQFENPGRPNNSGMAYLYSGASLALHRVIQPPIPMTTGQFGRNVRCIGDLDQDGREDYVISGPAESALGIAGSGIVHLYDGATGALLRGLISPNPEPGGEFGGRAVGINDVTGDGRTDIAVAAKYEDPGASPTDAGRVHVFDAVTGALFRTFSSPNEEENGLFGLNVISIKDFSGNGKGELLVGAGGEDPDALGLPEGAGMVYCFEGATGALLWQTASPAPQLAGRFGATLSRLDDVTGDGKMDVAVGAPDESSNGINARSGRVHLFDGATGAHVRTVNAPNPETGGAFGWALANIPDANGDGRGDLVVGAPYVNNPGLTDAGRVYVVSGGDGTVLRVVDSPEAEASAEFGFSVGSMPDLDGNGFSEYVIGARKADPGTSPTDAGRAYLIYGRLLP